MRKGQKVWVRCYSGVFFGTLVSKTPTGVTLTNARHIYRWKSEGLPRKALTVEDLAILGAGTGTQISGTTMGEITLADWKVIVIASGNSCDRTEALPCLA